MSLSTMRAAALVFAGLALSANAIDETFVNAKWTIETDEMDDNSAYLFSGIVKYDGKPLCDDGMTDAAATALCRHFQLGNYGEHEKYQEVGTNEFGADDLICPDDARGLGDCTYNTETENCDSWEGVRIFCSMITLQKPEHHEHEIPANMGIVNFNFLPVCDDHINKHAAHALCRTMNLGHYGEFYGQLDVGTDDFGMDNLICPEGAVSIRDCEFDHQATEDCHSNEGVGLICSDGFRLHGGDGFSNQGYVLWKGQAVCEVGDMTPLAADLLCQNIGVGTTGLWSTRDIGGTEEWEDRGFGADNPSCQRGESHLHECNWTEIEDMPCDTSHALYLVCSYDGWTMEPAIGEWEHGEDRKHSGFVYYNGEPLCDDFMTERNANMLCYTMHYGDYGDISLAPFQPGGDFRGSWETRHVLTENFGADNLWCPYDVNIQSINDCEWDTEENCDAGEGVWIECHKGWLLEKSIWGGDDEKMAGFLTFDRKPVCVMGFSQNAADSVCRSWFGPHATGRYEQKAQTSKVIWGEPASVTLDCPSNAHTVHQCTRGHTDDCDFTQAVYLECIY